MFKRLLLVVTVLAAGVAAGGERRSAAARAEFLRLKPCPVAAAGRRCPGYVVDHVVPLCLGGLDVPANMQWQTVEEGREKDKAEHAMCRLRRREAGAGLLLGN